MKRRVAVTGLGAVSAAGWGMEPLCEAVRSCRSAIRKQPRQAFSADGRLGLVPIPIAAVPGHPTNAPAPPMLDPFAHFAVHAAREALANSGLPESVVAGEQTGVVMGTGNGGDQARELAWERLAEGGRRPHPLTVSKGMCSAAASAISIKMGITGPAFTLSSACASSAHAIGQAFRMVQYGVVEAVLAGGAEELPGRTQMCAWQQMRVLADEPCRPFAEGRSGISLGEGAAVLLLESMDAAVARGAPILAEIIGFGMGADAHDWFQPSAEGLLRCLRAALRDADVTAREIGYVNAHATGTVIGDAMEAEALRSLLGESSAWVSSTKGMHGHAIGASGALEAAITVRALADGWVPGMPAAETDITGLRLAWQTGGVPAAWTGKLAISNSFGFGGLNGTLVFRVPHIEQRKKRQPTNTTAQGAQS